MSKSISLGSPNVKWLHEMLKQLHNGEIIYVCSQARLDQLKRNVHIPISIRDITVTQYNTKQYRIEKM